MTREIALSTQDYPIEGAVYMWLAEKANRTNSAKTAKAYAETMASFRAALAQHGFDLTTPTREVSTTAQAWAAHPKPDGTPVSASTHNQRLAIISSFYTYCRKRKVLSILDNPIEAIARKPVQSYASARPLDPGIVQKRMKAIDRSKTQGKRDYALLAIALQTGRRLSEMAGMHAKDMEQVDGRITLTFRAKGGKIMHDTLPLSLSRALTDYLSDVYPNGLEPDSPMWLDLHTKRGTGLSIRSLSNICQRRLGTSKVHALRHTFARNMEQVGAKVSDIQARLGHSNLATTGRYLAALGSAENAHADQLAALYGFE